MFETFEPHFLKHMQEVCKESPDPSHDMLHVKRVVSVAKTLATREKADLRIVVPAAYLHDCVYISKTDSRRSQASRISAEKAEVLLRGWEYPDEYIPGICHAIAAHSFSARIPAETLEAKVVQDADRLDAMGAVGISRCFAFSGIALRPMYNNEDPFCDTREPNDTLNTLDHFFVKLLRLQDRLNTDSARREGEERLATMRAFLESFRREISD